MKQVWRGQTVVCIASGPSLTADDCEQVAAAGIPAVAVNSSWQMARFCAAIYAGDAAWWRNSTPAIDIAAERWTCLASAAKSYSLRLHGPVASVRSSGLRAIEFAIDRGARRVLLLGYDCSVRRGTHWHGNHVGLGNPDHKRCQQWQKWFRLLADRTSETEIEIINCSRESALTCFPRMALETALAEFTGTEHD